MRLRALVFIMVIGLLLTGCTTRQAASPSTTSAHVTTTTVPERLTTTTTTPQAPHLFVIMMENTAYTTAISTPSFLQLVKEYTLGSSYYGVAHPSLPNYLALTSGSTQGITSDCLTCYVSSGNLADQLDSRAVDWSAFFEGTDQPCYLGTSYGVYAAKHNPFRYYNDVRASSSLCTRLQPLNALASFTAQSTPSQPLFAWITPDICHDGHDCSLSVASSWLTSLIAQIQGSRAWTSDTAIIVAWDEGNGGDPQGITPSGAITTPGGGHAPLIVVSPHLEAGSTISTPLNEYAVLATIEQTFGLPFLGNAALWQHNSLATKLFP
ncbi:MAG: alkaline phosphatase family protein [Acidimicrobiales bacterium]